MADSWLSPQLGHPWLLRLNFQVQHPAITQGAAIGNQHSHLSSKERAMMGIEIGNGASTFRKSVQSSASSGAAIDAAELITPSQLRSLRFVSVRLTGNG